MHRPRHVFRSSAFTGWLWVATLGAALLGDTGCLHGTAPALSESATPAAFTLPSTSGQLDSAAAIAGGPLVLIFYRGHW